MKKYELDKSTKITLNRLPHYRIKALKDFADVKAGDLGGYIQSEANLSQDGNCWVYDDAIVSGNARVVDNAVIKDKATVKNPRNQGVSRFQSGEELVNSVGK